MYSLDTGEVGRLKPTDVTNTKTNSLAMRDFGLAAGYIVNLLYVRLTDDWLAYG
jgi:hypothetical protein